MIVLDASAALELLLNTPVAPAIAAKAFAAGETLHAPHLLDLEVVQVLRRWERIGAIDGARAGEALEDLGDLPLVRYAHQMLLERVWTLRANATAYDATYLALAEALGATLLTRDQSLASVPGHSAKVEVVRG